MCFGKLEKGKCSSAKSAKSLNKNSKAEIFRFCTNPKDCLFNKLPREEDNLQNHIKPFFSETVEVKEDFFSL